MLQIDEIVHYLTYADSLVHFAMTNDGAKDFLAAPISNFDKTSALRVLQVVDVMRHFDSSYN